MASEMVERVARAIYRTDWEEDQSFGVNPEATAMARLAARAAIEAMREPFEGMTGAGDKILSAFDGEAYPDDAARVYRAMIDEALRDG